MVTFFKEFSRPGFLRSSGKFQCHVSRVPAAGAYKIKHEKHKSTIKTQGLFVFFKKKPQWKNINNRAA